MEFSGRFVETMTKMANESFFEAYDEVPVVYDKIFETKTVAEMGGQDYGQGTSLIIDRKPKEITAGQDHEVKQAAEGFTYFWATRLFQEGFQVTQKMLDNWKANPGKMEDYVKSRSREIGKSLAMWRDEFAAQIFNRGPIAAGDLNYFYGTSPGVQVDAYPGKIYDGQPFFSTAHPLYLAAGTTFANLTASLPFSAANLKTVLTTMRVTNAKNEMNRSIKLMPNVLLYNPSLDFDVRTVLESEKTPGTGNNDINTVKGVLEPIAWDQLTDTDSWFVGEKKEGLLFIERGAPMSSHKVDEMKGKGVHTWSFVDEFTAVVTQWRHWYAANIATS